MTKNEAAADALKKAEAERQAKRRGAARLNKAMRKALAGMTPPDDLTVTQWAEAKRRLSAESAAEPGPWRTERTPYLREPMDAFTDPKVRHIVMVAASQVGKSEFLNNCIGYIIDEDPGSILFIHPTTIDAQEYSKLRIAPMLRDSPALRQKIAAPKSRDSHNTILQKAYPGGILTMCGSTEAHALASKPIRYVFGDERDRWATSAGNEGDPWDLAMARQTTFYNAKAVEVSTTTIKNASAIEAAYYTGTMERWNSKCPHCGEYHEIRWSDIRFEYDEIIVSHKKTYKVKKVYYTCPGCGCISTEAAMKRAPAKWIAENPEAYGQGTRSFWLNAFVSQWASWESIVSPEVLQEAEQRLAEFPGGMESAMKRAMARATAYLRTQSTREIRKKYDISRKAIRAEQNIKVSYRYFNGVEAKISFRGNKIPLFRYGGASPSQPTVNPEKTVMAIINGNLRPVHPGIAAAGHQLLSTAPFKFDNAFVATVKAGTGGKTHTGIFERTGGRMANGGAAIKEIMGSSVPQMVGGEDVAESLTDQAMDKFEERLVHEVDAIVKGWVPV